MISRRNFLKLSAIAGVGFLVPSRFTRSALAQSLAGQPKAPNFSQSDHLAKFVQKLRMVGSDISLATADVPDATTTWWQPGVTHYTIDIGQFTDPGFDNPLNVGGEVSEKFTYSINWGDGTAVASGPATIDTPGGPAKPRVVGPSVIFGDG